MEKDKKGQIRKGKKGIIKVTTTLFSHKLSKNISKVENWRFGILFTSFAIVVLNPFINYKWGIHFIQGWFQSLGIGNLWVVSPLEGLESILTAKFLYMASLIGMLLPLMLAFLMGRVFCSWLCPITFISNLTDRILGIFSKKLRYRRDLIRLPKSTLWFALLTELLVTMILGYPMFVWWSPPGLVGREAMFYAFYSIVTVEIWIVITIAIINLATRRFFCRYLCPLGALLALVGKKRQLLIKYYPDKCIRCRLCDSRCPMGIKPSTGESESVYCWNCGECVDACPTKALKFSWRDNGFVAISKPQPSSKSK